MFRKISILVAIILLIGTVGIFAQNTDFQSGAGGDTLKYSTKDHPKAKGLDISLEYPKDWEAKEGERPNIIQKFSESFKDGSSVMCLILVKDLPSQVKMFSDEDVAKEMFSEEVIKSMFPGNSQLLEHTQTKYDGQPGALSSFAMVQERSGIQIFSYVLQHAFIYSGRMVSVQCTVGGLASNNENIQSLYKEYLPVFIQIGNSIILHDKWNKDQAGDNLSAMEAAFGEFWWLSLIISAILTWGVGLLLPVLVRFVIVRKPLSKKVAILLVCIFWVLNLVFFIAIGSQSKTHTALFLVAVASYYILRAGHKKLHHKSP